MSDPRGACKCALLEREVAALERLVGRYQQELVASASCGACGKRAHASLLAEEDELFERQQLDALRWDEESGAMVQLTRRNGQPCGFDAVDLPSCEWIWTSDWHIDVTSKTDGNGWTYASSHEDIDAEVECHSDRMIDHRVRRRRWKRQRKFIGSADLPQATRSTLDSEARLCALQHTNEKLTEQLRHANDQILEYEDRLKAYEAKLLEMQNTTPLKRPLHIVTTIKPHDPSLSAALPFSPSKSRDVLHQTEALLSQLLGTTEPVLLNEETREAQRRRSQMVMECQSELDGAVTEFHSLVQTMDTAPRRTTSQPTLGA